MDLSEIRAPVAADMQAADQLILRRLQSDVEVGIFLDPGLTFIKIGLFLVKD